MSHSPKRWSLKGAVFAASLSIVFAACGGRRHRRARPDRARLPEEHRRRRPSTGAVTLHYPETGDAPCGVAPYTGNLKKITAIDAPDRRVPAVQPGCGLPAEGRVQRIRHPGSDLPRPRTPRREVVLDTAERHGPYKIKEWSKGNRIVWEATRDYWGDKAKTPASSSAGATSPPPGCSTSRPARSTASTTRAPPTSPPSRATPTSPSTRGPG